MALSTNSAELRVKAVMALKIIKRQNILAAQGSFAGLPESPYEYLRRDVLNQVCFSVNACLRTPKNKLH
jgi:hypothetical protein